MQNNPDNTLLPTLAILSTTLMWGTWWVPLRNLDASGTGNIFITASGLLIPLLVLLPVLVVRAGRIRAGGLPLMLSALFFAGALALYAEGVLRGEVARVALFFYLTPVWSTLLARAMLGQPITRQRVVTLILGLAGMAVISSEGFTTSYWGRDWGGFLFANLGDILGLVAGVSWGLAMVYTRRVAAHPIADKVGLQFVFATLIFFALTLLPGGREWGAVAWGNLNFAAWAWILAFAFVWNLPVVWLTFYGGAKIEPGRVAILLMLEVVIAIVSAALFTDEPFGVREAVGAILIIAAGGNEFAPSRWYQRLSRG